MNNKSGAQDEGLVRTIGTRTLGLNIDNMVVASGSILIIYLGVSLAVIRLRLRDGKPSGDGFSIPGGFTVPVLSCLFIGWLLIQLNFKEAIGLAVLIVVSVVFYVIRQAVRKALPTEESDSFTEEQK